MEEIPSAPMPCPFCGSLNVRMRKDDKEQLLYCGNCRQRGPQVPSLSGNATPTNEEKAIVLLMWNHRDASAKDTIVKAVDGNDKGAVCADKPVPLTLNGRKLRLTGA